MNLLKMLQMFRYHLDILFLAFTKYLRYFLRIEKYDFLNDRQHLTLNIFQHLQTNAE